MTHPGLLSAFLLVLIAVVGPAEAAEPEGPATPPQRIVSLNLCTDELLMLIVPPERIVSISYLSHEPQTRPAYLGEIVDRIPSNRGLAEEVIMTAPDLVVTGTFSTRPTVALLRSLGYRVVDFAPENDFDDMRANIRLMGEITGETARAEAVITDLDRRLSRLTSDLPTDAPIYADLRANNSVAGADTLAAAITNAGGFRTLGETLGFSGQRQVSLEQVVLSDPDLISLGSDRMQPPSMATESPMHPALRHLAERTERVEIPARLWTCGSPGALEAAEILAEARARLGEDRDR